MQRKINRKFEWSTINAGKKDDAQKKIFLIILMNIFSRNHDICLIESLDCIEARTANQKLKAVACKNIVQFSLRMLSIEFNRLRRACQPKVDQELHFDHASMVKGMYYLKTAITNLCRLDVKMAFVTVKFESRVRSRRSIVGMTRASIIGGQTN